MTGLQGVLDRLVRGLDAARIPFMIAGSFASAAHGLPRTTQAIDVVIDPPGPEALDDLLRSMDPADDYVDAESAHDALRRRSIRPRAGRSTSSSARVVRSAVRSSRAV
jgi:hypothetical protein